jgi:uncharacterized protein YegP (UPF0339 family)
MGTFEIYRDRRNEYRWRLKAGNNRTIADSGEGYAKKSACKHGIEIVRQSDDFETFRDNKGEFRWRLRAANGRIIADSAEGYTRNHSCKRAIGVVRRVALSARVNDQTSKTEAMETERALTADFTAERRSASEPLKVSFESPAAGILDDEAISFAWDFGDGDTGTGAMIDHVFPAPGTFPVTLVVADVRGATDTWMQAVIVGEVASDELATSLATLYAGSDPTQFGVEDGVIDPARSAVLHGRVLTDAGEPLSDVIVTVNDHPEYGWTTSQADGVFEMVVNGGQPLVVRCELPGNSHEEQPVDAPWQAYATMPDVVLVLPE